MLNSGTGRVLKTLQVEGSRENDIFKTIDSLSYLIKNYLEIKSLEQEAKFDYKEAFTESANAYKYYIEGMKHLVGQNYQAAIQPLSRALEIDSAFIMAMFYLSFAHTFNEGSTRDQGYYWLLKATTED